MKFDENSIISKAVLEYFTTKYSLDINLIIFLSATKYEGQSTCGYMLRPLKGYKRGKKDNKNMVIKLENEIKFNVENLRKLRKLLEISTEQICLLINDKNNVIGFAKKESAKEQECKICISDFMSWNISYNNKIYFKNGFYKIKSENYNFYTSIQKLFGMDYEIIYRIIVETAKQKHGTIIILSDKNTCISETERLNEKNRCIKIRPVNLSLNISILISLTNIDGAVFIDHKGVCYCIGAILDGDASIRGDTSRGARYNSAINYIERRKHFGKNMTAVIISEDETLDIYR